MANVKLNSSGGGSVTIAAPSTASNYTVTLPASTGTMITTGNTSITFTGSTTLSAPAASTLTLNGGAGSNGLVLGASNNVGIGTSSPSQKLDVLGAMQISFVSGVNTYQYFQSTLNYIGRDTSGDFWINVNSGQAIKFGNGSTEKMRLDSNGNLLIGTTSIYNLCKFSILGYAGIAAQVETTNASTTFTGRDTSGNSTFYVLGTGNIYSTSTTITAISDQRLKENVRDLDDGLATILSLKPRKFDWKEGKGKDIKDDRGFIAQEFEEVFPDLIDTWKDPAPEGEEPYKSVRPDLIPVLVKAIQEQQKIIDALESRLAQLEAK